MSRSPSLLMAVTGVVLTAVALSACQGPEARRADHLRRGERYLAEGKLERAQIEFRNVLQIAPGDITARVMIGRVAEKSGNIREAFADYRAALDIAPENPAARACLARVYVFADEPQSALELVEPALLRFPNDPDLLTIRGAARAELQDTPEALSDAKDAVRIAPKNENAVALLASLYQKGGEGAKAVALLQDALKGQPSSIDLREILASVYMGLDEPELAQDQHLQIVKIAPQEFSYRMRLAQFYQQTKKLDAAQRTLQQAVTDLPESNEAKLAYVEFLSSARSPAEGTRVLSQFIAHDPHNYDLQLGFGELLLKGGDSKGALAAFRQIVAAAGEKPQGLTARNRIAAIVVTQGHSAEALKLVSEVLDKSPRDRDALIMRGNIELQRDDSAAAIADLRAVLRDEPDDIPILRTLARAHLANGEPALAESSLRDAVKAAPRDAAVRIDLAQLLMQSNRYPSAVAILEETVLEAPRSVEAREALAHAYIGARELEYAVRSVEDLKVVAPDRAVGWYLAGQIAASLNRPDEAQTQLEKGLQVEPNSIDTLAALVRLDVSRDRVPQAFARANAAVAARPGDGSAHNILGELYLATKNYPQAIRELQLATQAASTAWLPWRNLALAQIESGDLKAATATYQAAIAAVGQNPTLVIDLAALYERQGHVDEAIKSYRSLHDRSPRLTVIANNLAMLLVTYRKDRVSLNEAQELTSSFDHSEDASLLDTQGWVRFKSGDLVEALPELEAAAEHAPQSRVIRYHLAMAQLEARQVAKARSNLEAALEGGQSFTGSDEARVTLAKLRT